MAAQRYKDILFSYSGLISSPEEIELISNYFAEIQNGIAEADFSEVIDLIKYTIKRNPALVTRMLNEKLDTPFVFVTCLN